jgi:two-component system, NarL family, invasion response regulator UvrY
MKVLLVEDHGVVREGVRRLLSLHFDMTAFETDNVATGFDLYKLEKPDIVVLDINLEGAGGLELLRRLLAFDAAAKVIIFSMHAEPVYAARALKAGARGYVSKSAPVDELEAAVRKVMAGGSYVDQEIAALLATNPIASGDPLQALNSREAEILRLLGQGKSLTSIAESLGVAYKTVANNCSQMKVKLGVERTADLIRLGMQSLQV